MTKFLQSFFDTEPFIPHGHCYLWNPSLVWLNIISDALIALAYYSIPITLVYFVRKRRDLPFNWIFLLFGAFIITCGTTHLMEIWTLWHPTYWVSGFLKAITASISTYTAVMLIPLIPRALTLPSPKQLEEANRQLQEQIAERQQAETALKTAEERYRQIFENASEGIFQSTPDGRYISANPALYKLYGYESAEDLFTRLTHIDRQLYVDPNRRAEFQQLIKQGRVSKFESQVYRKDGSVIWISENAHVISDEKGAPLYYEGSVRDITQRKLADDALRASEERLQLALEGSGDGLWDWNILTNEVYLNPQWVQMLGYKVEELPGKVSTWEYLIHPKDKPRVMEQLNAHFQDASVSYRFDYRLRTKSGKYKWIANYGKVVVRDEQGKPLRMTGIHRDINDRKQNEEALAESEARFRSAFDGSTIGIAIVSLEGKWLRVNDSLCRIMGYSEQELLATDFQSITHSEDLNVNLRHMRQLLNGERDSYQMEKRYLHKLGHVVWGLLNVSIVRSSQSTPLYFITQIQDITDRKQAEAALHKLNEELELRVLARTQELMQTRNFLQAIVDNLPLAVFVKDGREESFGQFLLWNNTCETLFGCTREQAIGKTVYDFFPEEQSNFFDLKDRQSFERSELEDIPEEPIDSLNLGKRLLRTIKVPLFDENGNPKYLVCISEDITERQRIAEALRENEQRFRATFIQAPVGISQNAIDGKFLLINQSFCNITGYTEQELQERTFQEITHPGDLATDLQNFQRLLANEIQIHSMEKRYIHKNGNPVWINLTASLVRDLADRPKYAIAIVEDISKRKQAEEDTRKALEREKELSALKSQFITTVSHELRTPLAIIASSAELLESKNYPNDNPRRSSHFNRINRNVRRITQTIEDTLAIAELESQELKFAPTRLNLTDFCQNFIKNWQLSTDSNHAIAFICQGEPLASAYVDPQLLSRIFSQLLSNAVRYSPQGGKIDFELIYQSTSIVFQIRDEGIGIPEADRTRIFDRFYQASNANTIAGTPGSGLGLAIVKRAVDMHSGTISVGSELGKGSTFAIAIPQSQIVG